MAKFIPFPSYYDFAPLDISYVFEDENITVKNRYGRNTKLKAFR